jgi:hypothetical protein
VGGAHPDGEVVVKFQKRAHSPLLLADGFDKTDIAVTCPPKLDHLKW